MVIGRSATRTPQPRISVSAVSRVTPARIVPDSGGVMTSSPILSMMLEVPTSSMYLCWTPSSHSTWVKPSCFASSAA